MTQLAIFQPVLALVLLTFLVLLRIPYVRIRAALAQRVTVDDFRLGESPVVPADVALPNRNYMNLLELPLLFYVLALTLHVTQRVDSVELTLAWLYVGLRVLHSCVHLTVNHVLTRLAFFAASNFTLAAMWAYFAMKVL
ncbi:MAG: MAPEG family protein [Polyangiales bacterium]